MKGPTHFVKKVHFTSQKKPPPLNILSIVDKFVMLRIFPDAPRCAPENADSGIGMVLKYIGNNLYMGSSCIYDDISNIFSTILSPQYFISGHTWMRPEKSVTWRICPLLKVYLCLLQIIIFSFEMLKNCSKRYPFLILLNKSQIRTLTSWTCVCQTAWILLTL